MKDLVSQNAAELSVFRVSCNETANGILDRIKQLEEKLELVVVEQDKATANFARILHRQDRIIKPSHDIRLQLAFQEIRANGFWFVDIPRTSSTSVRVELGQQFGPAYAKKNVMEKDFGGDQYVGDHVNAIQMSRLMGAKAFGALLSFTIVRNPWARAYSLYSYRQRANSIPKEWSFADYCQRLSDIENNKEHFPFPHDSARMVDHICDEDGHVLVSRIIRFEDRHEGLAELAQEIGCQSLGALHVQRTSEPDQNYRSQYTPETEKQIGEYFAKDIELFGYQF